MIKENKILNDVLIEKAKEKKIIHYIDGNKENNKINNICLLKNELEHQEIHKQLEKLSFSLVEKDFIVFNRYTKKYEINPNFQTNFFERSLGFEEVAIKQKKNLVNSRLDVDIKSEFVRGLFLKIPLIAANMSTVINTSFYKKLYDLGALGIMHRAFKTHEEYLAQIKEISKSCDLVAASVGITKNDEDLAKKLIKNGVNILTIDVAHGYSQRVLDLAKNLKKNFPHIKVIIGNVVNSDIVYECYDFVDAIKVGIAQGFACETKNTAGCTEKQFSAVLKFKTLSKEFDLPIISDGGIREPSDFTKAIAAGANSVMAGSIFARCPESAAEEVKTEKGVKKIYAGMASRYVQNKWKGGLKQGTCPEGTVKYLDIGEPVNMLLERYSGALRSGITYAGGVDIKSFQENVEFIRII